MSSGLSQKVNVSILGGRTVFHGGSCGLAERGPSGKQAALGSGLGNGKEACNFDFTPLTFLSAHDI
jgi:hypothetical protein